MFANARIHATSFLDLGAMCKSLTMKNGRMPNVQSAIEFRAEDAKVTPTTTSFVKHQPYSFSRGECFLIHQAEMGLHWKIASKR